jgi:hypothetical protein
LKNSKEQNDLTSHVNIRTPFVVSLLLLLFCNNVNTLFWPGCARTFTDIYSNFNLFSKTTTSIHIHTHILSLQMKSERERSERKKLKEMGAAKAEGKRALKAQQIKNELTEQELIMHGKDLAKLNSEVGVVGLYDTMLFLVAESVLLLSKYNVPTISSCCVFIPFYFKFVICYLLFFLIFFVLFVK